MSSNLFSWCCRKFSEPTAKDRCTDDPILIWDESLEEDKPGSASWYDKDFKYNRAARVIKSAEREQQKASLYKVLLAFLLMVLYVKVEICISKKSPRWMSSSCQPSFLNLSASSGSILLSLNLLLLKATLYSEFSVFLTKPDL